MEWRLLNHPHSHCFVHLLWDFSRAYSMLSIPSWIHTHMYTQHLMYVFCALLFHLIELFDVWFISKRFFFFFFYSEKFLLFIANTQDHWRKKKKNIGDSNNLLGNIILCWPFPFNKINFYCYLNCKEVLIKIKTKYYLFAS